MSPHPFVLRDILLACRWAYYCRSISIVSDYEYDMLEFEYKEDPEAQPLPVGSSNPEDYPPGIRALGLYLILGDESRKPKPRQKISVPQDLL